MLPYTVHALPINGLGDDIFYSRWLMYGDKSVLQTKDFKKGDEASLPSQLITQDHKRLVEQDGEDRAMERICNNHRGFREGT